jgi:CMD domain protein
VSIATDDVIGRIAGITPGSRADRARQAKPELIAGAQAYYEATVAPEEPGGLSHEERALIAYRVSLLTPQRETATFYRERLDALGVDRGLVEAVERFPGGCGVDDRFTAIMRHVERVTTSPRDAEPRHLRALEAAGLGPFEIVSLSQLIAFVSYQARLVAALRAMESLEVAS